MKRFYKSVSVAPLNQKFGEAFPLLAKRPTAATERTCSLPAWKVLIDGRDLHTNAMNQLAVPTQALALAIAGEFAAQKDVIMPTTTPLYNLTCSAIDGYAVEDPDTADDIEAFVRANRLATMDGLVDGAPGPHVPSHAVSSVTGRSDSGAMTSSAGMLSSTSRLRDLLLDFLETDSTCYRIDAESADPSEKLLRKRQDKYYGPLLAWWRESFGVELAIAQGLSDLEHADSAYHVVEDFCERSDPFLKAAAGSVIGAVKSSVITMAFLHRMVDIEGAFQASRVEEEWQIAENGFVEDGHDTARAQLRTCLASASALLWLSPTSQPAALPKPGAKNYAHTLQAEMEARTRRVQERRQRERTLVFEKRDRLLQFEAEAVAASSSAKGKLVV
jgi:chaperone required for assembly of F1-ATPase